MTPSQKLIEIVVALILAAIGAAFLFASLRLPGSGEPGVPGPGAAPALLGMLLAVLGIGLAAAATRGPALPVAVGREPLLALLLMAVAAIVFEPLGFLPASVLFLFGAFVLTGGIAPPAAALAALAGTGAAWLVFTKLLGVGLPAGRLIEGLTG